MLFVAEQRTRAAQGKKGGISHLIYIAALALPEGKSMVDKAAGQGHDPYLLDVRNVYYLI